MKKINLTKRTTIPVILLFMAICLISNCRNNEAGQTDGQSLQNEKQQRSQLLKERSDTTAQENRVFEAALKGSNEAMDETNASGSVSLSLQGDSIHVKGQFSGLNSTYTSSYIHQALESDRIQELDPEVDSQGKSGSWEASYKLDKGGISMLTKDSLYISVYTEEYNDGIGELRGQLISKSNESVE